jgi:hypothetical protein
VALLDAIKDKTAQHIEIYDHLGDVHMALGEREAALEAWRRGLEVVGEGQREKQRRAEVEKKLQQHMKYCPWPPRNPSPKRQRGTVLTQARSASAGTVPALALRAWGTPNRGQ